MEQMVMQLLMQVSNMASEMKETKYEQQEILQRIVLEMVSY